MLTVGEDVAYEIEILVFFMLRTIFRTLFHLGTAMLIGQEVERVESDARRASRVDIIVSRITIIEYIRLSRTWHSPADRAMTYSKDCGGGAVWAKLLHPAPELRAFDEKSWMNSYKYLYLPRSDITKMEILSHLPMYFVP